MEKPFSALLLTWRNDSVGCLSSDQCIEHILNECTFPDNCGAAWKGFRSCWKARPLVNGQKMESE